jgi:hypothetical protein
MANKLNKLYERVMREAPDKSWGVFGSDNVYQTIDKGELLYSSNTMQGAKNWHNKNLHITLKKYKTVGFIQIK